MTNNKVANIFPKFKQNQAIVRGENFEAHFVEYTRGEDEILKRFTDIITGRKMTADKKDHSYRIINFWSEQNLIEDTRGKNKKGWRKFSLKDAVWINILTELRKFGMAIDKLKATKEALLMRLNVNGELIDTRLFEYYVFKALCGNNVYVLVFNDGNAQILQEDELTLNKHIMNLDSHITIHINPIIKKIIPRYNLPAKDLGNILSKKEERVIELVRSGELENITINLKNGEIESLDSTQIFNSEDRIIDILKNSRYSETTVKQKDGTVIYLKHTKKEKI